MKMSLAAGLAAGIGTMGLYYLMAKGGEVREPASAAGLSSKN